ncbi:outer membrane protein transport protein [Candidatus Sulfurimonas marisnigri]|uniref:Outer membrane protein transport protein n=1 Tax=Candidatus Sulfurimonas marisnigri TaxID=2740405 RepID=A0A7S7RQE6_9BACT|nr:outer membrane protein transport protein [Candidatus Sulfurimonas marisnigri]QOY54375.1 outer membrane protein transport protein [Candidatus Sulfurimonas marisnigri]
MKKLLLISLAAGSALMAGGYKIPETSLNAVALSAANVAHSNGADAAYYNPANMAFMKNESVLEADLMYIGLGEINYQGTYIATGATQYDINSKKENFLVPSLHYVSQNISGARFGLSIVSPAGLSKRWETAPAVWSAEEFTLQTIEVNPTVALPISDKLAVSAGLRLVHSSGIVRNTAPTSSRDMEGDSIDFGYNLALSYKPTKELEIGLTYRSNVDLTIEGTAKLSGGSGAVTYDGGATVGIPIPALLNMAIAYTLPTNTTIELVYERNYWHTYNELDFNYEPSLHPALAGFGTPITKNWKDVNAFRLGITQELDSCTLMGGVVVDNSPVPDSSLGYELPDSDSVSVSFGGRYQMNEKVNLGLAALYSMREDKSITNASLTNGEFKDSNVLIISAGLEYKF